MTNDIKYIQVSSHQITPDKENERDRKRKREIESLCDDRWFNQH
jgi:hypothetical protein